MTTGHPVPPLLATYRLQLTPSFGFARAAEAVPFLRALGISHLYVSPITTSRPGSQHGYDVIDPSRLDPELGGARGFATLQRALRRHDMGLIVDIVPNHMATHHGNVWWWRFLRNGPDGQGGRVFDPDPSSDTIVLPALGETLAEARAAGSLHLAQTPRGVVLAYHEHEFPLSRPSQGLVARAGVRRINADSALLDEVLAQQHYRLVSWREADEVSYRRFFDINELAGVRVEDPWVFERTHGMVQRLAARGAIQGVRVDHIDGLRDPAGYLRRLRRTTGLRTVFVEKILGADEQLPADLPATGTTGYEAATAINALQVEPSGLAKLDEAYRAWTRQQQTFDEIVLEGKRWVLQHLLTAEVERVLRALGRGGSSVERDAVRDALIEVTARLEVYRTYGHGMTLDPSDRARIRRAARAAASEVDPAALRFVRRALLREFPAAVEAADLWQQLSGPAMAKGFEDTALYRFNRLISVNDVGGEPEPGSLDPSAFVAKLGLHRSGSLNATSTHDAKRSEDVRARLAVLSEIPGEFASAVRRWSRMMRARRTAVTSPDPDEEWMLYQLVLGAWPLDPGGLARFPDRVADALVKSAREAKRRTSWTDPHPAHEDALRTYTHAIFDDAAVRDEMGVFVERIAWPGAINSLTQVVLKAFVPGIPDVYQGAESWLFAFVDPDNRRPVDLPRAARMLEQLDDADPHELRSSWRDGRIKLFTLANVLRVRARHRLTFANGELRALRSHGPDARHVVGLVRRLRGRWLLAMVPRFPATRDPLDGLDATLDLPRGAPRVWRNVFTRAEIAIGGRVEARRIFDGYPVALLEPLG